MNASKFHYCQEGGQRDVLLEVLLVFTGLRKGFSAEISHFDGKEWPIKTG